MKIELTGCDATTVTFTASVEPDPMYVATFIVGDLPHPCGVDPTHAEVRRVFENNWAHVATSSSRGEDWFDAMVAIAVSLGARAPGALRSHLHGPVRPLDGSPISDNPSPWRPRRGNGDEG